LAATNQTEVIPGFLFATHMPYGQSGDRWTMDKFKTQNEIKYKYLEIS